MKSTITVTSDFTKEFNEIIKRFKNDDVLVGIPESTTDRTDEGSINNATLFAIANFGSPINNIPAWPILEIGIRNAQKQIAEEFKKAASQVLSKGFSALSTYYNRAGIIASTSIKKVINSQEDVPSDRPLPGTIAARRRDGFKGSKYWLRTGQLRNSITYVLRSDRG